MFDAYIEGLIFGLETSWRCSSMGSSLDGSPEDISIRGLALGLDWGSYYIYPSSSSISISGFAFLVVILELEFKFVRCLKPIVATSLGWLLKLSISGYLEKFLSDNLDSEFLHFSYITASSFLVFSASSNILSTSFLSFSTISSRSLILSCDSSSFCWWDFTWSLSWSLRL